MNLVAYDKFDSIIDKSKTWICISKQLLMSREIAHRKYVTFGKRFNPEENITTHFVIILDDPPVDRPSSKLLFDGYGRSKISLKLIWYELGFNKLNCDCNITVKHTEHTDDGDIYELII